MFFKTALVLMLALPSTVSAKDATKGTLPELEVNASNSEEQNEARAVNTEVLISKAENQAINTLLAILKKKKGSREEPQMWFRLAELYMRRAKTGRFFDLQRDNEKGMRGPASFAPPEIREESAASNLRKASQVYFNIEKNFPKFDEMDGVLFNNGMAHEQLGLRNVAENLYRKIVDKHPTSYLIPDAQLAIGEINYDSKRFNVALEHFLQIEKYPTARVYSYGLYKSAWTLYNLRKNEEGIQKLIEVVKFHDPRKAEASGQKVNHNLRAEALRDLAIFFGETYPPEHAYAFFAKICTDDELGESMITLGKLYLGHSRYKELLVFLTQYIQKNPTGLQVVKARLLQVDANESMKNRKEVIEQLRATAKTCAVDSDWRKANKTSGEICDMEFAKVNLDIARKWWELWLKNQGHKEIAELTRSAFEIHLERDNPEKPDTKSRYAYGELLFQLKDYRKASPQYEIVGKFTTDTQNRHDANYAALVSLQKANDEKKESKDNEELLRLSKNYIEKHAQGPHVEGVKFKIAFIHYQMQNFDESEKWLRPIAAGAKSQELRLKSEDLILDILNNRKDFAQIKAFAKQILPKATEDKRKASLTKIMQEADYSSIQEFSKKSTKPEAAEKLYAFFHEHRGSPLAKDALWQSLSLYYSSGLVINGADIATEYVKHFPDDKRSTDALKDALKAYSEAGLIVPTAQTIEKLMSRVESKETTPLLEALAEVYIFEQRGKEARETLQKLADRQPSQQGRLYQRMLDTMRGKEDSSEYKKIQNKIVSLGHEPFASQILIKRLENMYESKNYGDAFNAAKQIVGSNGPEGIRAQARMIQAQILEAELFSQGMKTSIERLPAVLGLKTDRLDKAQTAYLSASKLSTDPSFQLKALEGLNRCYKNFVDSISNVQIKEELQPEEKKALNEELAKLTKPISDKSKDIEGQIADLSRKYKASSSGKLDYTRLPFSETVKPQTPELNPNMFSIFLPQINHQLRLASEDRMPSSTSERCGFKDSDQKLSQQDLVVKANTCFTNKSYDVVEKIAMTMLRNDPKSPWGTFYLGLLAFQNSQHDKASYLMDVALKKDEKNPIFHYQKALSLMRMDLGAMAREYFMKAYDLNFRIPEIRTVHALQVFAQNNCAATLEDVGEFASEKLTNFGLYPIVSECMAQAGNPDRALSLLNDFTKKNKSDPTPLLQTARVQELYKLDSGKALVNYEGALKLALYPEQKNWIQKKTQFLKDRRTQ